MLSYALIAALASVIFWIASQTLAKTVAPRLGIFKTAVLVVTAGILPMIAAYIYAPVQIPSYLELLSLFAGLSAGLGYLFFYKSVESEQISNIAVIGLVQAAIIVVFGLFFLNESINGIQSVAALMVFLGVLLILITKNMKFNMKLVPAIIANVFWAIYWILLSEVITISGQVGLPLTISRTTAAIVVIVAYFVFYRSKNSPYKANGIGFKLIVVIGIIEGIIDGLGNLSFGIAITGHLLAIAALLGILIPVGVAAIAHFLYKDRLTFIQMLGVAMAIIGAALIAIF